ncbi:hypothetical protein VARIO8X_110344 [Burkholderiales bacterium 8X]|nr:hypothetical protein VARIO8X_110344 [Burkholderiales bacterium 8X]
MRRDMRQEALGSCRNLLDGSTHVLGLGRRTCVHDTGACEHGSARRRGRRELLQIVKDGRVILIPLSALALLAPNLSPF